MTRYRYYVWLNLVVWRAGATGVEFFNSGGVWKKSLSTEPELKTGHKVRKVLKAEADKVIKHLTKLKK